MKQAERQGAIGVIRDANGRYLVIERSASVRAPGRYCFPGGGIEEGETPEAAVVRELLEELQLDILPLRNLWQSYTPSGVRLHWLLVEVSTDAAPTANLDEVARWFWMSAEEMVNNPRTLQTNREFLAAVKDGEIAMNSPKR